MAEDPKEESMVDAIPCFVEPRALELVNNSAFSF
jgi:hypothetical protein